MALVLRRGNEFHRISGDSSASDPAQFVAQWVRRGGGEVTAGMNLGRSAEIDVRARFEAIDARFPNSRTRRLPGGALVPIDFDIQEGRSRLGALGVGLRFDTRTDPILPTAGYELDIRVSLSGAALGSSYNFAKGLVSYSRYHGLPSGHVLAFHGLAGGVFGNAPFFEKFFVGDLNLLLPPRALGINMSTQPSLNFLGNDVDEHRYDDFAVRMMVEYAVPLWRRRGVFYGADAFVSVGGFLWPAKTTFASEMPVLARHWPWI